jgi:hypothetical protein
MMSDAIASVAAGRPGDALSSVSRKSALLSLPSVAVDARHLARLRGPGEPWRAGARKTRRPFSLAQP